MIKTLKRTGTELTTVHSALILVNFLVLCNSSSIGELEIILLKTHKMRFRGY